MSYEALIVRIGDALTNNDNGIYNQYGERIHIDYANYVNQIGIQELLQMKGIKEFNEKLFEKNTFKDLIDTEAAGIEYEIIGKDGNIKKMTGRKGSQRFVLGEDNQTYSIRTNPKTKSIEVVISIKSANDIPFCTLFAINERLGELDSRGPSMFKASDTHNLSLVIEFNSEPNADVMSLYELFRDTKSSITPIRISTPSNP